MKIFRDNPGPGTYPVGAGAINLNGGTILLKPPMVTADNASKTFKAPVWAEDYAKTPGPAAYLTDKFLREEEAAKYMQAIPNLGKAIQLGT